MFSKAEFEHPGEDNKKAKLSENSSNAIFYKTLKYET